jgi:DNA-binding XRE family transcriptional regulator
MKIKNNLKEIREARMLGKTELAKLAGVSPLTIDRIERGMPSGSRVSVKSSWHWD